RWTVRRIEGADRWLLDLEGEGHGRSSRLGEARAQPHAGQERDRDPAVLRSRRSGRVHSGGRTRREARGRSRQTRCRVNLGRVHDAKKKPRPKGRGFSFVASARAYEKTPIRRWNAPAGLLRPAPERSRSISEPPKL